MHQRSAVTGAVMHRDCMARRQTRERVLGGDRSLAFIVGAQPEEGRPAGAAQGVVRGALGDLRQPGGRVNRAGGAARAAVLVANHRDYRGVGDEIGRHSGRRLVVFLVVHRANLDVEAPRAKVGDGQLDCAQHGHADDGLRRGERRCETNTKTHVRSSSTLISSECLGCLRLTAASCGLLGLITAVLGLTRLVCALPVGMLSDRLDRKTVLVGGMVAFAVSFVLYALAPNAVWLVVPRVVMALAMVATFPLGIAYIGDIVETRDRGAAIGVYTAAMGSGFAVGPLLGSWVASVDGYPAAYLTGAVIAVLGAGYGAARLIRKKAEPGKASLAPRLVDLPAFAALIRQPAMVMACVANVAMTLSMTGAI